MRIQHIAKQPGLRNLVVLLHADLFRAAVPLDALLATLLGPPNLTKLLVVEEVRRQANVEDGDADAKLEGGRLGRPFGFGDGPVGGEPAAYADAVEDLEPRCHEGDEDVDGGHGRLDEGEEDGAVDVVDDLGC